MSELKPCPFCGNFAVLKPLSRYVSAVGCGVGPEVCVASPIITGNKKEIEDAWNRRSDPNA